jgi:hypothetical protein
LLSVIDTLVDFAQDTVYYVPRNPLCRLEMTQQELKIP